MKRSLTILALMLALANAALADDITKRNGAHVTGRIIEETPTVITVQSNIGGIMVREQVAKADIADIKRDARAETSYCRIPIQGEIGEEVKAEWVGHALSQARSLGARYVVLVIDSPGGSGQEMEKIIEVIKQNRDLKLVAQVKKAASAAAMIAMACRTIVIAPDGSIGAAVPWKIGPRGTPEDVEAKFLAIVEATCKSAAEYGGHSPLLVRAMMESDLVLSRPKGAGKGDLVEGEETGGTVVKRKGAILMLTGREAVDVGLASAVVEDVTKSPGAVGVKSWDSVGDGPWNYLAAQAKAGNPREQLLAQLDTLKSKLEDAKAQRTKAIETLKSLDTEIRAALHDVDVQYKKTLNEPVAPSELGNAVAKARETRDKKVEELREKYQPQLTGLAQQRDAALVEITSLSAQIGLMQRVLENQ